MSNKRSFFARSASVMMVLALLLSCFVCGTMANYVSTASGGDSIVVAKWSFTQDGEEFITDSADNEITFNLFNTVNDTDGGAAETDIAANDGTLIAPGTKGSFTLSFTNESQVNATYKLALTETNANEVPIMYSCDDGATWVHDLEDLSVNDATAIDMGDTVDIEIRWMWAFDGADENAYANQTDDYDTDLGVLAQGTAPEIVISALLTLEQVN